MSRPSAGLSHRNRGWLWTACAAALVGIYLAVWTVYSMTHLSGYPRYEQRPPGASALHLQADFRLLSLIRTEELSAESADSQISAPDTVWVVAELEVVQRAADPFFVCNTQLLGPDHRVWDVATVDVSRSQSKFCADENLKVGQPYGFEQVYEVPQRYANEIYGVVLVNNSNAQPNQVLSPPG